MYMHVKTYCEIMHAWLWLTGCGLPFISHVVEVHGARHPLVVGGDSWCRVGVGVTDVGNCAGGWGGAGGTGGRWEAEARQGMAGVSRGAAEGSQGSPRGSCGTTTGRTGECTTEGRGQPPWGWPGKPRGTGAVEDGRRRRASESVGRRSSR
jgi:hypothetical protein